VGITLGNISFDESVTSACERHEEIGGRNARQIELNGLISGHSTAQVETALDAILGAAADEECMTPLCLRPGRQLLVRRVKFKRDVSRTGLTGSFMLLLEAQNPFEESVSEHVLTWSIESSGEELVLSGAGTAPSFPVISLLATRTLVGPSFGDGTRTISYSGTVDEGHTLVFDGVAGVVTLDGIDVTPYTSGLFPQVAAGEGLLRYADDAVSSHSGVAEVRFRDRWW